ncbi:DUF167 domain-containing protein [Candidatus Dojkabacteria bacterium]|nr:DUF167 domain-containing protein [Candidatus Dojkabacteria bacterium]
MKVKVIPNSPISRISSKKTRADIDLVVELAAPAEAGKANIELIKFLRSYLGHDVKIVSGFKSKIKEVVVLT